MEGVRCPTIVGRAGELARLRDAVDAAGRGHGAVRILVGEAGVGKSRLATDLARYADESGLRVLRGRAVDGPHPVTFRPLTEAFLAALRDGELPGDDELDGFGPALGRLLPGRATGAADSSLIAVAEGCLRLLRLLGRPGGCLLVLEDLHWADPETLAVLEYLADHCAGERLVCVATVRAELASPVLELASALDARGAAQRISVRRLSDVDVVGMVRACLASAEVPSEVDSFVIGRADGLPFFVEELLVGLLNSGALVHNETGWRAVSRLVPAVPLTVTASIRARLDASPGLRSVLAAAATLGRRFDWALLGDITGIAEPEVLDALRAGTANQLLDTDDSGFRFRHALTRDAVLGSLLPPERARLAASAASAVQRRHPALDGDHCELAASLHEAAGDDQHAADLLLLAADRAERRGALTSAEALLVRSGELGDREAADAALLRVLALGGQTERVLTLGDALLARLSIQDTRRLEVRLAMARAALNAGDWTRAAAHVQHAWSLAYPQAPQLSTTTPSLITNAVSPGKMAAGPPPESGGGWVRGRSGGSVHGGSQVGAHDAGPGADVGGVAVSRAKLDGEPGPGGEAAAGLGAAVVVLAAQVAMGQGREGDAAELATGALETAERVGLAEVACEALEILGRVLRAADPRGAEALFERALVTAERAGLVVWRLRALHELGTIDLLDTGRLDRLEAARALAVETGALAVLSVIDLHLGDLLMVADRGAEANRATTRCVELSRRLGLSTLAVGLGHLAGQHATAGRLEAAEQVLEEARRGVPDGPDMLAGAPMMYAMYALVTADDATAMARFDEVATVIETHPTVPFPQRGLWTLLHTVYDTESAATTRQTVRESGAMGIRAVAALIVYADAVVLGRAGRTEDAEHAFAEAEEIMAGYLRPRLMSQLTRRLVAIAALKDGWGDPASWLRETLAWAEETGRDRLAADCRARLKQAGASVPRRARSSDQVPEELRALGVTPREMEVLALVAEGLSNAEIGERLFISPRTVEKHVEKLLARTGTRTRGQLAVQAERMK